jgi:voltage-gated potassium channel
VSLDSVEMDRSRIRLPDHVTGPLAGIAWRVGVALACVVLTTLLVYLDRAGYRDGDGHVDSLLDALYYSTVTLSTTGYGDITPVSEHARLLNVLIVTPLRLLFLIVLVGTTIEVLTRRTRQAIRTKLWRQRVKDHVIVVGYGVKGASAMRAIVEQGRRPEEIVVVDRDGANVAAAVAAGAVGIVGDATRESVLEHAGIADASTIVVSVARDDTAVLVTLTSRRLAPKATIVASVREGQNLGVVRQSGADVVIPTAESAGRMLGLSTTAPRAGAVLEDLLEPGIGLEIVERVASVREIGRTCREVAVTGEIVLEVSRNGESHRFDSDRIGDIRTGDVLVVIRNVN